MIIIIRLVNVLRRVMITRGNISIPRLYNNSSLINGYLTLMCRKYYCRPPAIINRRLIYSRLITYHTIIRLHVVRRRIPSLIIDANKIVSLYPLTRNLRATPTVMETRRRRPLIYNDTEAVIRLPKNMHNVVP